MTQFSMKSRFRPERPNLTCGDEEKRRGNQDDRCVGAHLSVLSVLTEEQRVAGFCSSPALPRL